MGERFANLFRPRDYCARTCWKQAGGSCLKTAAAEERSFGEGVGYPFLLTRRERRSFAEVYVPGLQIQ